MQSTLDIQQIGESLIKSVYHHDWRAEYDSLWIGVAVKCNGIDHDLRDFSLLIHSFQQRHLSLTIKQLLPGTVMVDDENGRGELLARVTYEAKRASSGTIISSGECKLSFIKTDDNGWQISAVDLPGIMSP